jgi:hypothetical protein
MTRVHGYGRTPECGHPNMTVGRILPKFVVPDDVRDLKNRVDPFVRAMDQSVADCKGLSEAVRTGWQGFSKAWRSYFDEEDSWLHTAAQMDQGEAYERDLARWQDWIAQFKCVESAPRITPSTDGDPAGSKNWSGTIKTVAIAGAVIAVALGLRAVVK